MAKEFNITRTSGICSGCQKQLEPGDKFAATLHEEGEQFLRKDFCLSCWDQQKDQLDTATIGSWQSQVPQPKEKKKLFVDNEVLLSFFKRLDGTDQPEKQNFRFVLGLILMQKRLLSYEKSRKDPTGETWLMRVRGTDETYDLLNPQMGEDQIQQVSEHLSDILEADV
ncbi:MAG: hypothetical protein ACLFUJ_11930 [Phycisphaerae bacterium]